MMTAGKTVRHKLHVTKTLLHVLVYAFNKGTLFGFLDNIANILSIALVYFQY